MKRYILEVRDGTGALDFKKELEVRKAHPDLFTKESYGITELCRYASYREPIGPSKLPEFMKNIGITYREKTWGLNYPSGYLMPRPESACVIAVRKS